jgi:hypothetical protein
MKPILDIEALPALVREIAQEVVRTELGERADDWMTKHTRRSGVAWIVGWFVLAGFRA